MENEDSDGDSVMELKRPDDQVMPYFNGIMEDNEDEDSNNQEETAEEKAADEEFLNIMRKQAP